MLPADIKAKATASGATEVDLSADPLEEPATNVGKAASIVGRSYGGQSDPNITPPDTTGAIGTTRFVQLVNDKFAIYNRTSNTPLQAGPLATLGNVDPSTWVTDPQVIWDPTTSRFYYTFLVINDPFLLSDNYLAVGFSKTGSPNAATDWCQYFLSYGSELPDYPKLGDSSNFFVIGTNTFDAFSDLYLRSDGIVISKPAAGPTCPDAATFKVLVKQGLKIAGGALAFTPIPANQIDTATDGYIVARNPTLPSTKLWLFKVTKAANGDPLIDEVGKAITLAASYAAPADATQAGATQKLDTLDARNTQAILAKNPLRANGFSLWTQHTIAKGTVSAVRWYEINPIGTPTVRRTGTIAAPGTFLYNAAISSDRRVDGANSAFGGSFVVGYSASSALNNIKPRILMTSSLNGGAVSTPVLVKDAVGPYKDFACATGGSVCRWGDYSGATPDPRPSTTATGLVWLTNQFSGVANPLTTQSNWRTWIWAAAP